MHSKNTGVKLTQVCVLQNTTLVSYVYHTSLCYFNKTLCQQNIVFVLTGIFTYVKILKLVSKHSHKSSVACNILIHQLVFIACTLCDNNFHYVL